MYGEKAHGYFAQFDSYTNDDSVVAKRAVLRHHVYHNVSAQPTNDKRARVDARGFQVLLRDGFDQLSSGGL